MGVAVGVVVCGAVGGAVGVTLGGVQWAGVIWLWLYGVPSPA